jgi:hypothetical protein
VEEWDHPPLKGWPRRPTPPHSKKPEASQPICIYSSNSIYTIELYRGVAVLTPPPVGKAGFEVWVLTKGGLVSVHHCRLYRAVVHVHPLGRYAEP